MITYAVTGISKMALELAWPTDYPVVTQPFGVNPHLYARFGLPGHEGLDIRAPYGAAVYACADGLVYQVARRGAYGLHVRIEHADGYRTLYAHLHEALVEAGERVSQRQRIGLADSTGNSTGSHLHLTLKLDGATRSGLTTFPHDIIDPTPFLMRPAETQVLNVVVAALSGVRVRSKPQVTSTILGVLPHRTRVILADPTPDTLTLIGQPDQWVRVAARPGLIGWCAAWLLERLPE